MPPPAPLDLEALTLKLWALLEEGVRRRKGLGLALAPVPVPL